MLLRPDVKRKGSAAFVEDIRMRLLVLLWLAAATAPAENYVFGFFQSAPGRTPLAAEEGKELQARHIANLGVMFEKGALLGAGPLGGGGALRGVILFRDMPFEDIQKLVAADALVQKGQLVAVLYRWSGPAGIARKYKEAKAGNPNVPDKMIQLQLAILRKTERWAGPLEVVEGARAWGAVEGDAGLAGIAVLDAGSVEAARAAVAKHPAVAAGRATAEVLIWYVADGIIP